MPQPQQGSKTLVVTPSGNRMPRRICPMFSGSVGYRYQDKYDRFPNAIAFITRAISFPLYPFLSKVDMETIQRVISHIN